MLNVNDLNLDDEILPLFDFTYNFFSGKMVTGILKAPLDSISAIQERQQIFRGFIANRELLKGYSYSRFNLAELYDFLESFPAGTAPVKNLRWKLTFSEKERHQKRGKLIQLILLFHKLSASYLSVLNTAEFPEKYRAEIASINAFFASLELDRYETVIRKQKFKVRHIAELMSIISQKVSSGEVAAFWSRWFLFEAYLSISNGIIKHGFTFPSFNEDGFEVKGLFHPLLKNPVKNDLITTTNVILLTGPNMSGKSTFLKAVSLCVYLAHTGVGVPAASASMPFFSTISVAINLTDSIVSGYSHFMSEVVTLKNVVEQANGNDRCFAVFDELFRGTNIEDALEISTATIRGLTRFHRSLFFISTHLHQLRQIPEIANQTVATWYIDCKLDGDTPAFTYQLKQGWSDLKLGRILFEKEGLNRLLSSTGK